MRAPEPWCIVLDMPPLKRTDRVTSHLGCDSFLVHLDLSGASFHPKRSVRILQVRFLNTATARFAVIGKDRIRLDLGWANFIAKRS